MRKLLVILALLAAVASACGGGDGDTKDLTGREIADEELSMMALPLSELGPQYADFALQEDGSGFRSNEERIDEDLDSEDEAEDVQRFGRVNGYIESYSFPGALSQEEGPFGIEMRVTLYEDAGGASEDLFNDAEDAKRQVGTGDESLRLEDAAAFDPDGIGDESVGLMMTFSVSGGQDRKLYETLVGFRQGRLLGSFVILRWDDEDVREEAATAAHKLNERILAVLQEEAAGP